MCVNSRNSISKVITQSPELKRLIADSVRAAKSTASILITGESGTGKELFSKIIHEHSQRTGPLVSINCAALPINLIESELFGHEKGAFTDAISQRMGRFESANHGTLLLDEITEVPVETQAKLLRVLESNEFCRVGSNEAIQTDARIIATSNRNLRREVDMGNFRLDLFHRLNVIEVRIPPLRDRVVDIPLLATHFVDIFKNENEHEIQGLSAESIKKICGYNWPGNVRELRNIVHRACILADAQLISPEFIGPFESQPNAVSLDPDLPGEWATMSLAEIERRVILASLQRFNTKREAADQLGVTSRTLANKLKLYDRAA